jgi:hypothetical protein
MTRRSRSLERAEWWSIRPARSLKPATYRCPICGYRLHAMSPHVLIAPEGDLSRRRHAHAECVRAARLPGRPSQPGLLARAATLFRPKRP